MSLTKQKHDKYMTSFWQSMVEFNIAAISQNNHRTNKVFNLDFQIHLRATNISYSMASF